MSYKNKRILVTGATGFIGNHLVKFLLAHGADVHALVRSENSKIRFVTQHVCDLKNDEQVKKSVAISRPQIVFHLAAYKQRDSKMTSIKEAIDTNVIGSLNLFEALSNMDHHLEKVVVVGTAEEYGNNKTPYIEGLREAPITAYSYSKLCVTNLCEMLYKSYNFPVVLVRPSVAYGPGQESDMFLPALIQSVIMNKPFKMTTGEQKRDFIYIEDLVRALIAVGNSSDCIGEMINIGSGIGYKIRDIALKVERLLHKQGIIQLGALEYRNNEIMDYAVDINKSHMLLNWQPEYSIEEGLKKTIEYYLGEAY